MLRWCSYCQQFLGEVPPYDNLVITHGICKICAPGAYDLGESEFLYSQTLKNIQDRAFEAGQRNEFHEIERIIDEASQAKIRLVDILLGIIGPTLFQIGEDWSRGKVTDADQIRYSAFCEAIFAQIAAKISALHPVTSLEPENIDALLMNAPGNIHTLGIRILSLWLLDKGSKARIIESNIGITEMTELISERKPKYLLISVALAEQIASVMPIVESVTALPKQVRPRIIIGGNAVKLGLVSAIPGAELLADINSL